MVAIVTYSGCQTNVPFMAGILALVPNLHLLALVPNLNLLALVPNLNLLDFSCLHVKILFICSHPVVHLSIQLLSSGAPSRLVQEVITSYLVVCLQVLLNALAHFLLLLNLLLEHTHLLLHCLDLQGMVSLLDFHTHLPFLLHVIGLEACLGFPLLQLVL